MFKTLPCLIAALLLAMGLHVPRAAADEPASSDAADKDLLRALLNAPAEPAAPNSIPSDSSGPPASAGGELTPTEQQLWNLHWHNAAVYYAAVGGDYYLCAKWDPRYPSSSYKTPGQWQTENTTTVTETVGGLIRDKKFTPPAEEATAAAMTIPELAPNHYGHIHSAKVVEVVSPTEMVVDEIQLIDADKLNAEIKSVEQRGQRLIAAQNERERIERQRERERSRSSSSSDRDRYDSSDNDLSASDVRKAIEARYSQRIEVVKRQAKYSRVQLRLIGYPTVGATLGARWSGYDPRGPQIAVVDDSASKGDKKGRSRNVELVAVNAEMLRKGLTEQQFDELLAARGMTRRDFVNMVREKLQANTGSVRDTQPFILAALEQARADYQKQQAESASGGEGDADAGSDSARRSDFLKQKYGDKKVDGEKPDAESKAKDKKSFFEQKYGDKSKTKDADAEAKE